MPRVKHGEQWRWWAEQHRYPSAASISVIEPPKGEADKPQPEAVKKVPFGFSRALADQEREAYVPQAIDECEGMGV